MNFYKEQYVKLRAIIEEQKNEILRLHEQIKELEEWNKKEKENERND